MGVTKRQRLRVTFSIVNQVITALFSIVLSVFADETTIVFHDGHYRSCLHRLYDFRHNFSCIADFSALEALT